MSWNVADLTQAEQGGVIDITGLGNGGAFHIHSQSSWKMPADRGQLIRLSDELIATANKALSIISKLAA